jgi:hypothetical protein
MMMMPDPSATALAKEKVGSEPKVGAALRSGTIIGLLLCGVFLSAFGVTSLLAWHGKTVTVDEPIGIVGSWLQTHHGDFRVDPEDPPLWKYLAALGTRSEALPTETNPALWARLLTYTGAQWDYAPSLLFMNPSVNADAVIRAARSRMIWVGVALGAAIAWWAWRLAGPIAGVFALLAFSLDPNFLAHSALVKNDVAMALVFVLLMGAVWLAGEKLTLLRAVSVALLTGAALSIKFSGVLAFPMVGSALLIRAIMPKPWPVFSRSFRTRAARLAAAGGLLVFVAVISYAVLWAVYDFRFSPASRGEARFDLNEEINICEVRECLVALHGPPGIPDAEWVRWHATWRPQGAVALGIWAEKHHLLPQTWIVGFLYTYANGLARPSFLLGESRELGWWYYFPLAMAFKTPLATLVGIGLAVFYWVKFLTRRFKTPTLSLPFSSLSLRAEGRSTKGGDMQGLFWAICVASIAPVFYMVAAMRSHIDLGLRHVVPVYPFLFILLGVTAAQMWRSWPKWGPRLVLLLTVGLAIETYAAFPNYISFFNVACSPWPHYELLGDSNVDWQQDVPALAAWQRNHPGYQIYLYYRGSADPRYYGLRYMNLPHSTAKPDQEQANGLPKVYAITPWAFQDVGLSDDEKKFFAILKQRKPLAVLNDCIYLYDKS